MNKYKQVPSEKNDDFKVLRDDAMWPLCDMKSQLE